MRENYNEILISFWTAKLYKGIQERSNNKYSISFLDRLYENTIKWIETDPANSIIRLRKLDRCSYCDNKILPDKNGDGDHIVGKELEGASWQVPCCFRVMGNCQSSKGNGDLIEWWLKKGRTANEMKEEVLSIYVRAKYRLLKKQNRLYEIATQSHHIFLKQLLEIK